MAKAKERIKCDQCSACMINGMFCHETGCLNWDRRWVDGAWVKVYVCSECGMTVPINDPCCSGEDN